MKNSIFLFYLHNITGEQVLFLKLSLSFLGSDAMNLSGSWSARKAKAAYSCMDLPNMKDLTSRITHEGTFIPSKRCKFEFAFSIREGINLSKRDGLVKVIKACSWLIATVMRNPPQSNGKSLVTRKLSSTFSLKLVSFVSTWNLILYSI